MAFRFKVGYTKDPDNIEIALNKGILDEGDLIIVNDNTEDKTGHIRFITDDKEILTISAKPTEQELQDLVAAAVDDKLTWDDEE